MTKLDKLHKEIESIQAELEDLEKFRDTEQLRKFKRQLQGEASNLRQQIKELTETIQEKQTRHEDLIEQANKTRSAKNKRTWNYLKSIQENYYPDKSLKEIRSSLKKHREGLETDISDVAWRNPSP